MGTGIIFYLFRQMAQAWMLHDSASRDRALDCGMRNADFGMKTEDKLLMNYYMSSQDNSWPEKLVLRLHLLQVFNMTPSI
jgi:hypothetical protein